MQADADKRYEGLRRVEAVVARLSDLFTERSVLSVIQSVCCVLTVYFLSVVFCECVCDCVLAHALLCEISSDTFIF